MTTPDPANRMDPANPMSPPHPAAPVSRRRRAVRLTLLVLTVAVLTALAASLQLGSR